MRWESVDMKQINNVVQKTVVKLFKGSSFSRVSTAEALTARSHANKLMQIAK